MTCPWFISWCQFQAFPEALVWVYAESLSWLPFAISALISPLAMDILQAWCTAALWEESWVAGVFLPQWFPPLHILKRKKKHWTFDLQSAFTVPVKSVSSVTAHFLFQLGSIQHCTVGVEHVQLHSIGGMPLLTLNLLLENVLIPLPSTLTFKGESDWCQIRCVWYVKRKFNNHRRELRWNRAAWDNCCVELSRKLLEEALYVG